MAAVCVAIFCLGQKGTRKKIFHFLCICRVLRYSYPAKICVMSRPSHVSERSLQRSEFERAAHGFSRFPNALELQGSETKPQHIFFFFTYLLDGF